MKELQRLLGLVADGIFGAGTSVAVREFRTLHGAKVDGIVGSATWALLFEQSDTASEEPESEPEPSKPTLLDSAVVLHRQLGEFIGEAGGT